jgi:hypothetical protein
VKYIIYGLVTTILAVIVFVRAGELGGDSGGAQASTIINSTAKGAASIINAAQGYQA